VSPICDGRTDFSGIWQAAVKIPCTLEVQITVDDPKADTHATLMTTVRSLPMGE
jgi:hypothetical protein